MRRISCLLIPLLATFVVAGPLMAQTFPTRPIRVIVGFPPGSTVDVVARALSVHMQKDLGQPLIVESRPGAGGAIAAIAVVKADPDGHTLFFGFLSAIIPALVKNSPVDARKELAPVSDSLSSPWVFYSSAKLPVKTLQELVVYAKTLPPNTLNVSSSNSQSELLTQLVRNSTGITYTLINYQGGAAIARALITGEVSANMGGFGLFIPHLNAGAIRALFVSTPRRMAQFPGIPTAAEVGIPNLEAAALDYGFWAPRGTLKEIVDRLSRAAIAAVNTPDIADLFRREGYEAVGSAPEAQLRKYEAAAQFWTNTARMANFQPQ